MLTHFSRSVIAFLVIVVSAYSVLAQQTINNASISGRVTDPSGAVVSGAGVTARQTETNVSNPTTTDSEGRFRFPVLPVGEYEVTVRQQGFANAVSLVKLTIGAAFDLQVVLSVGASQTNVTVIGEAPVIETARTQVAGTVTAEEVHDLPLNGRNYLDLALLVPGMSPTNTAATQLFAETSAVPGQGISASSQRNFSNSFIVDGLSANDDAAGLTGTFYGLGVVQEFQVVTSGGQAEFGRALGGYISMVTKSGTNSLHGDVYGYLRNQRFNATNAISQTKLPLTQAQYGASLGGPIIKDRTFFFANFEQRLLNQFGLITVSQANINAINTRLTAAGYAGPQIATGQYPNPIHNANVLGRVDHKFGEKDQFNIRYSLYDVHSNNSRSVGGTSVVSAASGLSDLDQTIAASNIHTFSPRTVNETRGQFTNSTLNAPANDSIGPAVSISGIASFGTASGSPTARLDKLFEIVDNVSHQAGAHALRVGVDLLYNDLTITYPRSIRGSYSFSNLTNFQNGTSTSYTQTFGIPTIPQTNSNLGFYGQDSWQVNRRLTLNAGVRYDLQFLKSIATDTNNFSPRVGFAWTPFASRRTVVRGSFGLFYDRVPLRALANALLSAGNTTNLALTQQKALTLNFGQLGAPIFPNIFPSVPTGVLYGLTTMNPNMQNAYSEQASVEVEQQIGPRGTLSVGYQHLRGAHLIISQNLNVPTCPATPAPPLYTVADPVNLCRPNSTYSNNSQYSPAADSQYDALLISYVQRPTKWGSFRLSYTFSKGYDNVGEFFFSSPLNLGNIHQDWGLSDDDQRHRLVLDGTIHSSMGPANTVWEHISHGFQLSSTLQYYSALPFNITTGLNTIQATGGRPCPGVAATNAAFYLNNCPISAMIGRNTGTGFSFFNMNTRVSRTFSITERFRLEAIGEAFNILNHPNSLIPNTSFGSGLYPTSPSATFGKPTQVSDPRTLQLALRVSF